MLSAMMAVAVAALAGFAVGGAWYAGLSRPWMEAAGIPRDPSGGPANGSSPMPFAVALAAMVLVAGALRHLLGVAGIQAPLPSLLLGLEVGALIVAPWIAMNVAYGMRPARLALIDGGYAVLGCGAMGLVLGLF